jgi:acyl-CoA synthetase (AMP-forming)/AMP-acid ligase II
VATALTARGVEQGQRVALLDNGSVLSVATILAASRVGASSAQMNVQLTVPELRALADAVEARVGVAGPSFRAGLAEAIGPAAVLSEDDVAELDGPHATRSAAEALGDGDDEALVLFTSGTTGLPKPSPSATRWCPSG